MKHPFRRIFNAIALVAGELAIIAFCFFCFYLIARDFYAISQSEPFFQRSAPTDAVVVITETSGEKLCHIFTNKIIDPNGKHGVKWWNPSWFILNLNPPNTIWNTPYTSSVDVKEFAHGEKTIKQLKHFSTSFGVWYEDGCFINQ